MYYRYKSFFVGNQIENEIFDICFYLAADLKLRYLYFKRESERVKKKL